MSQQDTIRLELTVEEGQTIIDALQGMPWARVANLIPKIMRQANQSPSTEGQFAGVDDGGQNIPAKEDTRNGGRSGKVTDPHAPEGVTDGE